MLIKYIAVKYVGGFQTQLKIFFFEVAIKKSVGSYACILPLHYGDIIWGDKSNETLMSWLQILQNKAAKVCWDAYLEAHQPKR